MADKNDSTGRKVKHLKIETCDTLEDIKLNVREEFRARKIKLSYDNVILDMCKVYVKAKKMKIAIPQVTE